METDRSWICSDASLVGSAFLCVDRFCWLITLVALLPQSETNNKLAPRIIHNRPGPVGLRECLVQVRYVAAARRPGKRRLWVSRELRPLGSSAYRLSFCLWQ